MRKLLLAFLVCFGIFGCIGLVGCNPNTDTGSEIIQPTNPPSVDDNSGDNTSTGDETNTDNNTGDETNTDDNKGDTSSSEDGNTEDKNEEEGGSSTDNKDDEKPNPPSVEIVFDEELQRTIVEEIKNMLMQVEIDETVDTDVYTVSYEKSQFVLTIDLTNYQDYTAGDYVDLINAALDCHIDETLAPDIDYTTFPIITVTVVKMKE